MKSIAELYKARFGLDKDIGNDLPKDGAASPNEWTAKAIA